MPKYYRNKIDRPNEKGEVNFPPSQTIQGEALSMKEILERYAKGQQINSRNPIYLDAESLEYVNRYYNPGALDLTDLQGLNEHVDKLQQAVQQAIKERDKKQAEETQPTAQPEPETETE